MASHYSTSQALPGIRNHAQGDLLTVMALLMENVLFTQVACTLFINRPRFEASIVRHGEPILKACLAAATALSMSAFSTTRWHQT